MLALGGNALRIALRSPCLARVKHQFALSPPFGKGQHCSAFATLGEGPDFSRAAQAPNHARLQPL